MRMPLLSAAVIALFCSASAHASDTMSLNQFPHRVEPVLVQVDARGKVTSASPAYELPPKMTRLLNANLNEMIRSPATDKNGKPVSSQFIMNVALQAQPNGAGEYSAHFAYVSTRPVPPGNWYWVHLDGDRLALASQDSRYLGRHPSLPVRYYRDGYRPAYRGNGQPMPATVHAVSPPSNGNTSPPPPPPRTR